MCLICVTGMSLHVVSFCTPKRPNASRCSFINARGFCCPNYVKHTYNGKQVCNVHLNTLKANEECSICITPMDNPLERIKLGCGHYFHVSCLGQCIKTECPQCRQEMLPQEKRRVFMPTRVYPLFEPVFNMNSSRKQTALFGMVGDLVETMGNMSEEEADIYRAYISTFTRNMRILKNAPMVSNPCTIMFEWMNAMNGAIIHLAGYGSYNGFMLNYINTELTWGSQNPSYLTPIHVGLRAGAPSPMLPMSPTVTPFARVPTPFIARSPSPVLPGYYN